MINTVERVYRLAEERNMSLSRLLQVCGLPRTTFYSTAERGSQLKLDSIDRICTGLGISLSEFFAE